MRTTTPTSHPTRHQGYATPATALFLVIVAIALGTTLFSFRQQRLEIMHRIALLHSRIIRSRQNMWDLQTRVTTHPQHLKELIEQTDLNLEPIVTPSLDPPQFTAAEPSHGGH